MADGTVHGPESTLRGGLLRRDLSPKPACEALRKLIREEWTTSLNATAGEAFEFDGIFGQYEITSVYRGSKTTHSIALRKGEENTFLLSLGSDSRKQASSHSDLPQAPALA